MMRIKGISLIFILLISSNLLAQKNEVEEKKYERLSKFPLFTSTYSHYPQANLDHGKVGIDLLKNELNIAFPIKPKKTYVSVRLVHSLFKVNSQFESKNLRFEESYQSFEFGGGIIKILPKRWRLIGTFSTTIASDFKSDIHKDDWIYRSNIMATKRVNQNTSFTVGLLFTTRFGNSLILPMLGYVHKKNKWLTNILLPAFASVHRQIGKDIRMGIKMTIDSDVFNADLRSYEFYNDNLNRLAYTRILIGPELLVPIYKDIYFQLRGGFSLRNDFETQDINLEEGLSFDAKTRSFVAIGITVLK